MAWLVAAPTAWAAPGDLDPAFSQDGKATFGFGGARDVVEDVAVDAQGRTYVAGAAYGAAGTPDIAVARLLADGSLDPAFGADGVATTDFGLDERAAAVEPAPGGGAYVLSPTAPGEGNRLAVLRFGADGDLDPAFDGDGIASVLADGANAIGRDMALTGGGQVVVAGMAHDEGERDLALARFEADGSLDASFGGDGTVRAGVPGTAEGANAVTIDGGGRIVIGGGTERADGSSRASLAARFLPGGDPDPSFSGDGFAESARENAFPPATLTDIVTLGDGAIVGAGPGGRDGGFSSYSTSFEAVFTADGEVLARTTEDGRALGGLAVDAGGELLTAYTYDYCPYHGSCTELDFVLDRTLGDGSPDPEFGSGSRFAVETDFGGDEWARAVAVGPDGRIVVAGVAGSFVAVSRYLVAPGPRDSDADGVLAGVDLCERSFAPGDPLGCRRIERSVDLRLRRRGERRLTGAVESDELGCMRRVEVEVIRTSGSGKGPFGTGFTNGNGNFSIERKVRPGRYRAVVRNEPNPFWMCAAARSRAIEAQGGRGGSR